MATGDGLKVLDDAAEKAAVALAVTIPVAGALAGSTLLAVTKSFTAVKDTVDAFAARGRELSGYSGPLAAAAARQDVTRLLTDINESQRLGDKYAKLLDKQTEFEETLKAGLLPIKEFALEQLPKFLNWILDILMKSLECLDKMVPGKTIMGDMLDEMKRMRRALSDGLPGPTPFSDWSRIASEAMRVYSGPGGRPAGGLPWGGAMPVPLGIPAFDAP